MTLVSVIIPTYNRAQLLVEAVNSVLAQTHQDFEIIVVDDGSTDDTAEVIQNIPDPRIKVISQDNAGRSVARNRGLQAAIGTYIGFLDDDDLYLPEKLAREIAFLDSHPEIDMVACGTQFWWKSGEVKINWQPWKYVPEPNFLEVLNGCPFVMCGVLIRREFLYKNNLSFDPELIQAEDTGFFIHLALAGCKTAWLEEILGIYRNHAVRTRSSLLENDRYHRKMLEKLYSRDDLPEVARAQRWRVYQRSYLFLACRSYACGWISAAHRHLLHASLQETESRGDFIALFQEYVVRMAAEPIWVAEPVAFIDFVFDNLPAPLSFLSECRSDTLDILEAYRRAGPLPRSEFIATMLKAGNIARTTSEC